MDLLRAWSTAIFKGTEYLSPQDLEDLKKSNLPMTAEELREIANLPVDEIYKAIATTKKPPGPPQEDKAAAPGNAPGLPRQGGGDSRSKANTVASADAATVKKDIGESASDIYYVSKRDYPTRPKGAIGDTLHSWKVPFGVTLAPPEKGADEQEAGEGDEPPPQDPVSYAKIPKDRKVLEAHLKAGRIVDIAPIGVAGATDSSKIVIHGNGAGIMKPNAECLYEQRIITSKNEPKDKSGWTYDKESKMWSRVEAKEYDIYSKEAIGTFGSGNIPYRRNVQREVAAYKVANLLGIGAVPLTVPRDHGGKAHSVQDFKPGCKDVHSLVQTDATNKDSKFSYLDTFKKYAGDQWESVKQRLKDYAVFDAIINNQDRHSMNFLLDSDKKEVYLIDHGFSFGNGMHGSRNFFMHHVFHGNEKITMSETLKKSILNKSLSDFERAMPDMYDWEAGQTFLRSRYMVWMQATNGSIDKKKFLHVEARNDGKGMAVGDKASWSFAGTNRAAQASEMLMRKADGSLPYQVFDRWAKGYIEHAASIKGHPDHEDCKKLKDLGVFMEVGFCSHPGGAQAYREAGLHKKYESSLKANMDMEFEVDDFVDPNAGERETVVSNEQGATRNANAQATRAAK